MLARFKHRSIVQIYRFFRAHGAGYIAMEYVEGQTLSDWLVGRNLLTEVELKKILFPLLDGLEEVHRSGVMHRDIKPGNIIMRAEDDSPVLLDFGAARQTVMAKSRSVTAILTPGYAPGSRRSGSTPGTAPAPHDAAALPDGRTSSAGGADRPAGIIRAEGLVPSSWTSFSELFEQSRLARSGILFSKGPDARHSSSLEPRAAYCSHMFMNLRILRVGAIRLAYQAIVLFSGNGF